MRKTALLVAYLTLFTSAIAAAQTAQYRHNGPVVLNDLTVTPGQIDPTHDRAFLCSPAFRTGSIRNVTKSTKWKVCDEYGIARKECNKVNVEIDHLVPLEDGGTNDISNLWAQPRLPRPAALDKDILENKIKREVCAGRMDLPTAQHRLMNDWYAFWIEVVKVK
jgi:hypothetical protein